MHKGTTEVASVVFEEVALLAGLTEILRALLAAIVGRALDAPFSSDLVVRVKHIPQNIAISALRAVLVRATGLTDSIVTLGASFALVLPDVEALKALAADLAFLSRAVSAVVHLTSRADILLEERVPVEVALLLHVDVLLVEAERAFLVEELEAGNHTSCYEEQE